MTEAIFPAQGDNPTLPPSERLPIHRAGVKALTAYNEGVLHAQGPIKPIYNAATMDTLLKSFEIALDNANLILEERNVLLKAVNESIGMLKDYNDNLDAKDAEYPVEDYL